MRPSVLLALTSVVAVVWFVFSWGYIEDDGFIHLEYARSLLGGKGFAFDGRAVFADSSPLWVFALAAVGGLGIPLTIAAKLVCALGLAALIGATYALTTRLLASHRTAAAVLSLVTSLNPFVLHWAFAGMEAVAGAAVALWLILLSLELQAPGRSKRSLALFLVAAGLAPLLRYELGLLSALAMLQLMVASHRRAGVLEAVRVLALGVLAALPILAWSVYAWLELGSVLPTTGPAKSVAPEELTSNAVKIVGTMLLGFALPIIVGALAAFVHRFSRVEPPSSLSPRIPILLWLWPLLVLGFYGVSGTAMQTRYAIAPGIALTIAAVVVTNRLGSVFRSAAMRTLLAGAAFSFVAVDVWMLIPCIENRIAMVALSHEFNDTIRQRVAPNRPIAVYGIGQAAFELPNRIVDTGGLTLPGLLDHRSAPEEVRKWALAEGAECFIDGDPVPEGFEILASADTLALGWFADRSRYSERARRNISCRVRSP